MSATAEKKAQGEPSFCETTDASLRKASALFARRSFCDSTASMFRRLPRGRRPAGLLTGEHSQSPAALQMGNSGHNVRGYPRESSGARTVVGPVQLPSF